MKTDPKDLFVRAHELSGEAREAYLQEACGEDAELRLEVQRLLVKAEKFDSFFRDEDGATLNPGDFDATYTEAEGDEVGSYTLRQQIGEGGFGTVWMAEQSEPISRMVALKVVKAGMDTKQVLARFEAERQALAMMDHPNIAKVLDAGATAGGRPYFAMELVKGIPVTEFCEQQKFGPRRRLELFKDVCSAVNHAHQKGIIHRDLKPSNIMVTLEADQPVVKVIDFGIAKATHSKLTEKTLFTRFEQFLGTPVYMSPEQAAMSNLDVDTRSDIYSLGVLLYELLAGAPPFDQKSLLSAGYDEMRRIIAEDEPPKPSTRLRSTTTGQARLQLNEKTLKGELDWIVMKALEKDRSRRYETANAFAADIGRFLDDEPVLAAAPSAAYKFRKFAQRNRAAFGVATAMLLLLIAGIAATSWQAVRATAERNEADKARAQSDRDREIAFVAQKEAEEARWEAEAVSKFLADMFRSSRPGAEQGGREVRVVDALDWAAQRLESKEHLPPRLRPIFQGALGETYYALGLYREAIALQERARDYYVKTFGSKHPETLSAEGTMAVFQFAAGQREEALQMQERVLKLSGEVLGPNAPETIGAMGRLAISYSEAGRPEEALKMQEQVLRLSREVLGAKDPETLSAMANLALSYFKSNRFEEALKLQEKSLELKREVLGPEHPDTFLGMSNLAHTYQAVGRPLDALGIREQVLTLSRKINGTEHPRTIGAMLSLANSYKFAARAGDAQRMFEEAVELSRRVKGPEHPDTLVALSNLANFYSESGRLEEALAMEEEILALTKKIHGPTHRSTLGDMTNLGISYARAGRLGEAIALLEKSLELKRTHLPPGDLFTLNAMTALASFYNAAGRRDEALPMSEEVLELMKKYLGETHRSTLGAMTNLATIYAAAGRLDEAIELLEASLALKRKHLLPRDPFLKIAIGKLAHCYEKTGEEEKARPLREELAQLEEQEESVGSEESGDSESEAEVGNLPAANDEPAPPAPPKTKEIEFLEDVLSSTLLVHDEDHEYTLAAKAKLAAALRANGDEAAAGKLEKQIAESKARAGASAGDE